VARLHTEHAVKEELRVLYAEVGTSIFRYCYSRARDRDLAREAVQESFLRYLAARRAGLEIDKPSAWLLRVARNYLIDQLRARPPAVEGDEASRIAAEGNPETLFRNAEEQARREAWLTRTLSPRERECIRLRWAGMSYHAIGELMGIESGTVGTLLARALAKLRNRSDLVK
jgi:RNA polymerase sigma-70 factor (ECF subfamily)